MNKSVSETEFVYDWWTHDDNQFPDEWMKHRILKRTKEFVYVARKIGITEYTIKLRRVELETKGSVWWRSGSRTGGERFYSEAGKKEFDDKHARYSDVPEYLRVFGLTWEATSADIHQAYREAALKSHPDTGGSHERFLKLQDDYRSALALVK